MYTIEDVKSWFGGIPIQDTTVAKGILTSLSKYGNNAINSSNTSSTAWHKIFTDCLTCVNVIPSANALDFVRRYRDKFKNIANKNDDELNAMTKKGFVELFGSVMKTIFDEETPPLQPESETKVLTEDCPPGKEFNSYTRKCDGIDGGSKKKSHKHSTRKYRRSRHQRRHTATRKYKKSLYKRV